MQFSLEYDFSSVDYQSDYPNDYPEDSDDDYNHDDSTQWCVFMIFCLNRYLNFALENQTGKVI